MIGRNPEFVAFGPFRFIAGDGLWRHGQPVALPPRAVAVLTALLRSAGTVVSKQDLMDAAWPGTFVTESSLLEAIGLLREALGDDCRQPTYIQTVHRRGYRFIAPLGNIQREFPPFFSGPEWRPIIVASGAYALTTICVAIVFAILGQHEARGTRHEAQDPRHEARGTRHLQWPAWTPSGLEITFAISKAGPFNLSGPWHEFPTSWSPDGNESGRWDVYLRSSSGAGGRVRVSSNGGAWPSWSNDGGTVYFSAGGLTMASAIRTTSGVAAAAPALVQPGSTRAYGRADLRIVLDWFSELASHVRPS